MITKDVRPLFIITVFLILVSFTFVLPAEAQFFTGGYYGGFFGNPYTTYNNFYGNPYMAYSNFYGNPYMTYSNFYGNPYMAYGGNQLFPGSYPYGFPGFTIPLYNQFMQTLTPLYQTYAQPSYSIDTWSDMARLSYTWLNLLSGSGGFGPMYGLW